MTLRRRSGVARVLGSVVVVGLLTAAWVVAGNLRAELPPNAEAAPAADPGPTTSSISITSDPLPAGTPAPSLTVAASPAPSPAVAACQPYADLVAPATDAVPADLTAAIAERLADPRFGDVELGASIWVEGYGEVVAHQPDLPLLPASNQKILTAMGALSLLDLETTLVTEVLATGPVIDGRLAGDLVLVAGGDPTLESRGSRSLEALARQVRDAGLTEVEGRLLVDESRYDTRRDAHGWLDWHFPTYIGSLSALMVDGNQYRSDEEFLAEPAIAGTEVFRRELAGSGVSVRGATIHGQATQAMERVASVESPTILELVRLMLLESDNPTAELLVKEIGLTSNEAGSTEAGLEAIGEALDLLCLPLAGNSEDGSGMSRLDRRPARELRSILMAAQAMPWFATFAEALPVAGESGTLASRFRGTVAAGNVRAKTGSTFVGRALSGFFTTTGGRRAFFSVITNGAEPAPSAGAIDDLVVAVAADQG